MPAGMECQGRLRQLLPGRSFSPGLRSITPSSSGERITARRQHLLALRLCDYLRVREIPSCRHHTWFCLGFSAEERPEACDNPTVPTTFQERAWSSPCGVRSSTT